MASPVSVFGSAVIPFRLVLIMWALFFVDFFMPYFQLKAFGIYPRTLFGLVGIFTAPMLHGSFPHLVSNTVPLLFLGSVLFFFYTRIGGAVFFRAYFWTNILVWLFARGESNHIGASGVIYALAFFLIFLGFFRRDFISIFISIIVLLLYGGVFYGVLPTDPYVSWESHLAGALVGVSTAVTYSRQPRLS